MVCWGLFLHIRSPKFKSEHTAPTFQPLASGLTPHMPIFGRHEIFTFKWEGQILKWKSTQLNVNFFLENKLFSICYIWKATKSGSASIFGNSNLFHYYLNCWAWRETSCRLVSKLQLLGLIPAGAGGQGDWFSSRGSWPMFLGWGWWSGSPGEH